MYVYTCIYIYIYVYIYIYIVGSQRRHALALGKYNTLTYMYIYNVQ